MVQVSPAREAAFQILLAVERGRSHSDNLLRGKTVDALPASDRNLTTALVLGVQRWQIRLDEQIRPMLTRPRGKLDAEILIALRLGAFQLLYLDRIPAHAAIGESVELAKRAGHRYAAGMVNAVLRKVAAAKGRQGKPAQPIEFAATTGPHSDDVSREFAFVALAPAIARDYAHPAWLVERWMRAYGGNSACAICAYGQTQPRLSVRAKDTRAEAELEAKGIQLASGELLAAARIVVAGDVMGAAAYREGRVRIQDEGSQLIGEIAASAARGLNAKRILDACAAPGGKTLILAERNPEARIVACEESARRLAALRERLSACASRIEFRQADAAAIEEQSVFDLALADVPCSGTGTLGRNPEIRHRLRAEDLPRQAGRQREILRAALRAVRPGGRVVYSTCSLEPEENEEVVAAVLTASPRARQIPVTECTEQMRHSGILKAIAARRLAGCVTAEGALRLLPGVFGTDGFYVALLEKTA